MALQLRVPDASCRQSSLSRGREFGNALQYRRICPYQDSEHFDTNGRNLANSDEDAFVLHRGAAATVHGEDCLRVNVWTPEINASHKRPVMV
jgi:para-nitrobenzyl esterase